MGYEDDRLKVIEHGGDDFVSKPFRQPDIFQMMELHLGVRYRYSQRDDSADKDRGQAGTEYQILALTEDSRDSSRRKGGI